MRNCELAHWLPCLLREGLGPRQGRAPVPFITTVRDKCFS